MSDIALGTASWRSALADWVEVVVPSPSGEVAAIGSLAGDAVVVDLRTGDVIATLADHAMGVLATAWSPDGSTLAVGGQDGAVRRYGGDGRTLGEAALGGWVAALAWSPDGRYLAAAAGRRVHLLDGTGAATALEEQTSTVTALAWSADGSRLGVAAYGGVRWYEPDRLPDTAPARSMAWKGSLLSLVTAPDGRWACSGAQDNSIHLWRLWSGDDLQMSGYPSKVEHLAFHHDSRWMAAACLGEVTVWDFGGKGPAGRAPATGEGHDRHITAIGWQPGGDLLASAGADGRVALWPSPRRAGQTLRAAAVADHDTSASTLAWLPTGDGLLVGRADGAVELLPVERPS